MEEFVGTSLTFIGHEELEYVPPWLGSKYGSLATRVDLSSNNLRSLKGLSGFKDVVEVMLDNNQLTDDAVFQKNHKLQTLTLNKNNIKSLEKLVKQLAENTPNLTYLSLLGNEACPDQLSGKGTDDNDYQRYRYYVLYHLPKLQFLDSSSVTAEELKEAQRIGAYMKTISTDTILSQDDSRNEKLNEDSRLSYEPLPGIVDNEGNHKSSFGKCRYVYHGKQSEGNRFIVDGDL